MSRQFSLGYKKPSCWDSLAVGVGKKLTNARIKHYIKLGRYGNLKLITAKKPSGAIQTDRTIRKLVNEYNEL